MDGGKLSEVNARTESRRQNASDLVSIRGQVMEYTYIPKGIKGEMVRSGHRRNHTARLEIVCPLE